MIIEFSVENFRSIKTRQKLSLVKSKFNELENNTFSPLVSGVKSLLKSSALYGANASGKSNLIKAFRTMQQIIEDSAKNTQRGNLLPVSYFKLCDSTHEKPTEFEVLFIAEGVKYQYGFSATKEKVHEEWLYAFPKSKPQRWFIRVFDKKTDQYAWDFSSFFTGRKELWKEATRDNSLFLSTAIILNNNQLKPVYDWFAKTLKVTNVRGWGDSFTAEFCSKAGEKNKVLEFLNAADLDINDLRLEVLELKELNIKENITSEIKEYLLEELKGEKIIDIKTVHKTAQGKDVLFDLDEESDGTKKIFSFAGPWIDALAHGKILVIDELHDSLHPNIVKFLIQLFHNKKTNSQNAQLIFTTHETSILDQDIFRRDQIWFCKKEKDQATTIYPLSDFSPRKGIENLEKAYLAGRYGALPVIHSIDLIQGLHNGE